MHSPMMLVMMLTLVCATEGEGRQLHDEEPPPSAPTPPSVPASGFFWAIDGCGDLRETCIEGISQTAVRCCGDAEATCGAEHLHHEPEVDARVAAILADGRGAGEGTPCSESLVQELVRPSLTTSTGARASYRHAPGRNSSPFS